jgi:hypothetical protein
MLTERRVDMTYNVEKKIDSHIDICVVRYESIYSRLKRLEQIVLLTGGSIIALLVGLVLKTH